MHHDQDDRWLARTLELARQGGRRVEPNPRVGAVIVNAGEVVATGFHQYYGGLHAERAALEEADPTRLPGSTLYCNLEPCSHRSPGKHQPPCTEAIIAAGITRVVIGQRDPNPAVRGGGVQALRHAGITVDVPGEGEDGSARGDSRPGIPADIHADSIGFDVLQLNEVFNTFMALGRPFVHLKAAISLDGRLATAGGDSRWITDEKARAAAHRIRAEADAVLVGRGTVDMDDPLLTVRLPPDEGGADLPGGRGPRPVVLDSLARISLDSRLVRERSRELLLCLGPDAPEERRAALAERGVTLLEIPPGSPDASGRVSCSDRTVTPGLDPASVLRRLGDEGIRSLFVEGGAEVLTAFLRARLYDRLTLYYAPLILGRGREAVGNLELDTVARALRFEAVRWQQIGLQQCFTALRAGWREEILAVQDRPPQRPGPERPREEGNICSQD